METNEDRLDRLHRELAHLYRSRVTDPLRINHYWVRIDRLEDALTRERLAEERAGRLGDGE